MSNYNANLFHDKVCFARETLEKRMEQYGLKNIARMEMFLWDLEIFLQIQNILKDRIVLKGGAAVQFYIPTEYQRTSIDIDMIFCGTKVELLAVLKQIENRLGANDQYFKFREHIPKAPKTELSLHTFFLPIPSVCYENELRTNGGKQEIKVEFISYPCKIEMRRLMGKEIFAVNSNKRYNVLSVNNLLADKLTTLGPNSIGIQNNRMDEQIKQFFDIHALMIHNTEKLDLEIVREKYLERAEIETQSRKIEFDQKIILIDTLEQLCRFSNVDMGKDKELKKYIDDFQSSYVGRNVRKSPADWAIVGEQIKYLVELIFKYKESGEKLKKVFELEELLLFKHLSGVEKGKSIKEFKDMFIGEYASYSRIDPKILKGKNLSRVLWAILNPENVEQIEYFISDYMKDNTTPHKADEYDEKIKQIIPYYDFFHMETIDLVKSINSKPAKWLDTGCGTGTFVMQAAKMLKDTKFLLADPSSAMLDITKNKLKQFKNIEILKPAPSKDIEAENEMFDVITAIQAHHYGNMQEREANTKNCFRMLKQGGVYVTFENIRPLSKTGLKTAMTRIKNYHLTNGRTEEDGDKHAQRFDTEYFPITIPEHLDLLKAVGFASVEILWASHMQAGFYAVRECEN